LTQFFHISEHDDRIILNVEVETRSLSRNVYRNFPKAVRIARFEKHIRALVCEINDNELGFADGFKYSVSDTLVSFVIVNALRCNATFLGSGLYRFKNVNKLMIVSVHWHHNERVSTLHF